MLEGRYRVHPRAWIAGRAEHLWFSPITGTRFDGEPTAWDAPVTRVEVGAGLFLTRQLVLKAAYQHAWRDAGRTRSPAPRRRPTRLLVLRRCDVPSRQSWLPSRSARPSPWRSAAARSGLAQAPTGTIRGRVDIGDACSPARPPAGGGRPGAPGCLRRRASPGGGVSRNGAARGVRRGADRAAPARSARRGLRAARPGRHRSARRSSSPTTTAPTTTCSRCRGRRRSIWGATPPGESKSVRFDRPGIVRVFCDIHSHMNAWVLVFAHRFFAVTDAEGRYRIDGVPAGHVHRQRLARGGQAPSRAACTVARQAPRSTSISARAGAMRRLLRSLANRIFLACAAAGRGVDWHGRLRRQLGGDGQAERELHAGLDEAERAGRAVPAMLAGTLAPQARLVADLPKLKAAVEPRPRPDASSRSRADYRRRSARTSFVVTDRAGAHASARDGVDGAAERRCGERRSSVQARSGAEGAWFSAARALSEVVSVPIWIDPAAPEVLGTLSVAAGPRRGAGRAPARVHGQRRCLHVGGRVRATTRPDQPRSAARPLARPAGPDRRAPRDGEEYMTRVMPLPTAEAGQSRRLPERPGVVMLRSRTEQLRFLAHPAHGARRHRARRRAGCHAS